MSIFNRFEDTIFLKEDSTLEKQIEQLEQLKPICSDPNLYLDLKLLQAGLNGEKSLEFELKNNNLGMYVLHDINIEYEDLSAQIDYVVITSAHCYLIECKNMFGNITINKEGQFIRDFSYNGRKIKEAIYSPYTQAKRHKEIYIKIWSSKNNIFNRTMGRGIVENYYKELVVFVNPKGILNVKYAPKDIKERVIRADQIIDYLKNDIRNSKLKDNQKDMELYANNWLSLHNPTEKDYTSKYEINKEDNSTSEKNLESIKEQLIAFRKEISKVKGIPAYYVFTNKELDALLELNPKNMEELVSSKIFGNKRLNEYGQIILGYFTKEKI